MTEATFTPDQDVIEPLDGGGSKVLFTAGTPIAWATAYALGLVSTPHPPVKVVYNKAMRSLAKHADSNTDD